MDFPGTRHQFPDRHRLRPWRQATPYEPTWRDRIAPALEILAGAVVIGGWCFVLWLWIAIAAASQAPR